MPTITERNARATAARGRVPAVNYNPSAIPGAATAVATFATLADTAVSAEVAEHARMVALYRDADAALRAHETRDLEEAEAEDRAALADALAAGKDDPGTAAADAFRAERTRFQRHAEATGVALLKAFHVLLDAIAEQEATLNREATRAETKARASLERAVTSAREATSALDRAARVRAVVGQALERGERMKTTTGTPSATALVVGREALRPGALLDALAGYRKDDA
ncbi:hypothetical protein [Aquipuribacter sp. SD81]|uniref:hypothetical protein n=1 Tax=Aquipuribacter sp. SD81 TaxID=3127703 RepID=UPI0030190D2F